MFRRAPLAQIVGAVPSGLDRQASQLGRPLAALVMLAAGASMLSAGVGLLGDRNSTAIGHVMAGTSDWAVVQPLAAWPGSTPPVLSVEPAAPPLLPAERQLRPELHVLVQLEEGAFGIAFAGADAGSAENTKGELRPTVLVDAERPPLRIEIMGLGYVPHRARGVGNALVRAP